LLQAWLDLICQMLPGITQGVVLSDAGGEQPLVTLAQWPAQQSANQALLETAQQVFRTDAAQSNTPDDKRLLLALPLQHLQGQTRTVVAVDVTDHVNRKALIQQLLEWGQRWLSLLLSEQGGGQQAYYLPVLEQALQIESLQGAVTAVATTIAKQLACQRLTVGVLEGGHFTLVGASYSSTLDRNSSLLASIKQAMMVAVDQAAPVFASVEDSDIPAELEALLQQSQARSVTALLLLDSRQQVFGVILIESADSHALPESALKPLSDTAKVLGPLLHLKWLQQQPLGKKLWLALNQFKQQGLSRGKLIAAACCLLLLALFVMPGEYRVTAKAQLEGRVQQSVVAPFDAYVEQSLSRAGATVIKGDLLARLDDDSLQLERQRWINERDKFRKQYRKEFAALNHSETRILKAQMAQAEARLQLLDDKLKRVEIVAPIDGIIISGDLSRSLGAPIEKGTVLFEVAPLDDYRLVLLVEERDIPHIEAGQQGRLTLTAQPGRELSFVVEEVATLFEQQDGVVRYRTEARLLDAPLTLRPGMGGGWKSQYWPAQPGLDCLSRFD
jgi:multidrug resistance efflux pump